MTFCDWKHLPVFFVHSERRGKKHFTKKRNFLNCINIRFCTVTFTIWNKYLQIYYKKIYFFYTQFLMELKCLMFLRLGWQTIQMENIKARSRKQKELRWKLNGLRAMASDCYLLPVHWKLSTTTTTTGVKVYGYAVHMSESQFAAAQLCRESTVKKIGGFENYCTCWMHEKQSFPVFVLFCRTFFLLCSEFQRHGLSTLKFPNGLSKLKSLMFSAFISLSIFITMDFNVLFLSRDIMGEKPYQHSLNLQMQSISTDLNLFSPIHFSWMNNLS